jgi:hypothetical protein
MKLLFSIFFILSLPLSLHAQTQIQINGDHKEDASQTKYSYFFDNEKFTTPHMEISFDAAGKGEFKFKKKDSDEMVNKLEVSTTILAQINSILSEVSYFESNENYQHKKDFSHLGTITIDIAKSGKHRKVIFNYTENIAMNRLANIFRNLATQETRVFELEAIRQNDPISTPAQLRYLESEMKSKNIADPERFTPILKDINQDESVPLIARNHAKRLLDQIQKPK